MKIIKKKDPNRPQMIHRAFSGLSHSYDTGIAAFFGDLHIAVIYNHILFWIKVNKSKGTNFIEGRTWTYETAEQISKYFGYFTERQVRHCLGRLVEEGFLVKGNFNKNAFDRTSWYSLPYEEDEERLSNKKYEAPELSDAEPKLSDGQDKFASCIDTDSNTYGIEDILLAKPPSPPKGGEKKSSFKKKKEDTPKVSRIDRRPNIQTSEEEHQKLVSKYGLTLTESCYDHLSEWKSSKSESDPKAAANHTDYYRIIKWVYADLAQQKSNQPSQVTVVPVEEREERRAKIISHQKQNWKRFQEKGIYFEDKVDHVVIGHDKIYYGDMKYKELVTNSMRKLEGK